MGRRAELGHDRAVEVVLDFGDSADCQRRLLRRSTVASGGRGIGAPGRMSSSTRFAPRYWLATRLTSSGVTAKTFSSSVR